MKSLLNGHSISSLAGAQPKATLQVEVHLPASSMAEALDLIHRLGHTGSLSVNFHNGKALNMKWLSTRQEHPPDI